MKNCEDVNQKLKAIHTHTYIYILYIDRLLLFFIFYIKKIYKKKKKKRPPRSCAHFNNAYSIKSLKSSNLGTKSTYKFSSMLDFFFFFFFG